MTHYIAEESTWVETLLMLTSPEEADHQCPGSPTLAACSFQLQGVPRPPPPFAAEHPLNSATPAQSQRAITVDMTVAKTKLNSVGDNFSSF